MMKLALCGGVDVEHNMNYVLSSFRERVMVRAVAEEAMALTSLGLFLAMIAIWTQVLGVI